MSTIKSYLEHYNSHNSHKRKTIDHSKLISDIFKIYNFLVEIKDDINVLGSFF
jgi:hypothetical protein